MSCSDRNRILLAAGGFVALWALTSGTSIASTSTSTLAVTATSQATCSITSTVPLAFGNYNRDRDFKHDLRAGHLHQQHARQSRPQNRWNGDRCDRHQPDDDRSHNYTFLSIQSDYDDEVFGASVAGQWNIAATEVTGRWYRPTALSGLWAASRATPGPRTR